jgi:hypothetical protein
MKMAFKLIVILSVMGLVSSVMAAAPADKGPAPDFKGQITKVDTDKKMVSFRVGMGSAATEVSVSVDDKTTITLDGNPAKLTDLKADLFVRIFGQANQTATKIEALTTAPGRHGAH